MDIELKRLRWLASAINDIYIKMVNIIQPGMREDDLAAEFLYHQSLRGIACDVLIAGSDERLFHYRHPTPTSRPIEKYIMLHTAARKWGLHSPVTRSYFFGEPSDSVKHAFQAVALIQAGPFCMMKPNVFYKEVLKEQKRLYSQAGYPNEWKNHFQGGPTGYIIVDSTRCQGEEQIYPDMAFEWFSTVPGAKIAELTILTNEGFEIASCIKSGWPLIQVNLNGSEVRIPGLFIIE